MATVVQARPERAQLRSSPLIELSGVEKVYRTGKLEFTALRGVDLTIWPGEMVAVVGRVHSGGLRTGGTDDGPGRKELPGQASHGRGTGGARPGSGRGLTAR